MTLPPMVESVSRSPRHGFSKAPELCIRLIARLGVEGDVHSGVTVKHLHRVRIDPTQPNLRQVHLIHAELHDELRDAGFRVAAGDSGRTSRRADSICLHFRAVRGSI